MINVLICTKVYRMLSHQTIAVANNSQCKFYTKVTHQSKLKNDRIEDKIVKYDRQRGIVAFLRRIRCM